MEVLRTSRLSIVTWAAGDLPQAVTLWGDPEVMALLDKRGALTREQVAEKLAEEIRRQIEYGIQYWKVVSLQSGEFIGCCGLRENRFDPQQPRELGFHIVRAQWSKGYATEAARGVIRHAFEVMKLPKLTAGHHPENATSRAILLKLGFRYLGREFYAPSGLYNPVYELENPG
jgi:[ribosomal protein S5]-alanine N-acetyltransferase